MLSHNTLDSLVRFICPTLCQYDSHHFRSLYLYELLVQDIASIYYLVSLNHFVLPLFYLYFYPYLSKKKKKNFISTLLPKMGGEWPSFELKLVLSIQEISRALCQYENLQLPAVLWHGWFLLAKIGAKWLHTLHYTL